MAVCAASLAWSTAQFSLEKVEIDAIGLSIDLQDASIPLLLGAAVIYLSVRWIMEFAMMRRHVRRWPLAQLDFYIVSFAVRLSLLSLAAAAVQRSARSVFIVAAGLAVLFVALGFLTTALIFITMPIRMWARERAGRVSAASASGEAVVWALLFAALFIIAGNVAFAVATYRYQPLREWLWSTPPDPLALLAFVVILNLTFVSYWLLKPLTRKLFAERPSYRTSRGPNGELQLTFVHVDREPLL